MKATYAAVKMILVMADILATVGSLLGTGGEEDFFLGLSLDTWSKFTAILAIMVGTIIMVEAAHAPPAVVAAASARNGT